MVVCCSSGVFDARFFAFCFLEIFGPPTGSPYSSFFSPKLYVGLTGLTGVEGLVFVFCNTLVLGDEVFTLVLGDDEVDPFVNTLVLGDAVDVLPPFPDVLLGLSSSPFTDLIDLIVLIIFVLVDLSGLTFVLSGLTLFPFGSFVLLGFTLFSFGSFVLSGLTVSFVSFVFYVLPLMLMSIPPPSFKP